MNRFVRLKLVVEATILCIGYINRKTTAIYIKDVLTVLSLFYMSLIARVWSQFTEKNKHPMTIGALEVFFSFPKSISAIWMALILWERKHDLRVLKVKKLPNCTEAKQGLKTIYTCICSTMTLHLPIV